MGTLILPPFTALPNPQPFMNPRLTYTHTPLTPPAQALIHLLHFTHRQNANSTTLLCKLYAHYMPPPLHPHMLSRFIPSAPHKNLPVPFPRSHPHLSPASPTQHGDRYHLRHPNTHFRSSRPTPTSILTVHTPPLHHTHPNNVQYTLSRYTSSGQCNLPIL